MIKNQKLSPEFQFILDCCKSFSANNKSDQFEFLNVKEHLNEEVLYALIQRHRILPLITFFILKSNYFSESFKRQISIEFSANQLSALKSKRFEFLFEEFLSSSSIFGFAFKGVSLANDFYGDIAMRQVYDVDLFVEQNSFEKVHQWLLSLGYADSIEFNKFTNLQKRYFKNSGHDLSYFSDDKNLPGLVELHWRLREGLGGFSLEPNTKLDKVDEFLYLCVHGTEHAWFRVKWICDILQILRAVEFDWDEVKRRALELNCITHINITWLVLKRYFQIHIPSQIENQIDIEKYRSRIQFISYAINMDIPYRTSRMGKFKHLLFLSSLKTGKIGFINISKYLTSHNDWKLLKMPDYLFFVYFLLRPFLWVFRGLLSFIKKPAKTI